MKKIVILRASGNELANQLWNYASIFAYAREREYAIENPSFFEYGEYFTIPAPNWFLRLFFFLPFKNYTERKTAFRRRVWRKLYSWLSGIIMHFHKKNTFSYTSPINEPYYLPPTKESDDMLRNLEDQDGTAYFDGWLFRNPVGLEKYRNDIRAYFRPRTDIENHIRSTIESLRKKYATLIGVHIRQGDYLTWRSGAYSIPQTRVREVLDEYVEETGKQPQEICFVITSDGPIDASVFKGLNVSISTEHAVHDLFLLASTDVIIGSDSTFGAFASYYGNSPFIVMQKEPIDWKYYVNKKEFFQNKYSTMVHY